MYHYWPYRNLVFDIVKSHRIPDAFFDFFHHDYTLLVISTSKSPSVANVDTRYANEVTLYKFSPCRLILEFTSEITFPVNIRYSVFFLLILSPRLPLHFTTLLLVSFQPLVLWCYKIWCHNQTAQRIDIFVRQANSSITMAKGQLSLSEDQVLPQLGSCQLALHWCLPAFSLLHTIILLWHSRLHLSIPLDMASLCIMFLWMFFPSVAMLCILHPLYFTRYKAKLFLFINCFFP